MCSDALRPAWPGLGMVQHRHHGTNPATSSFQQSRHGKTYVQILHELLKLKLEMRKLQAQLLDPLIAHYLEVHGYF